MAKKITVDANFMVVARERMTLALAADAADRAAAEEDVDFVAGNQWRADAAERRRKFKQPILTWNRLPTFVSQVCNEGRENKPAIKCTPMDGGTKETAEFYQDRIRHIEYESDADIAYDTARRQQVISARAFIRVATEFKPGKTFAQTATIEPIENQFSVLFDPTARKYDRSDAGWCFVFSWWSKDAYELEYGKGTAAAASHYFASGDANPAPGWIGIGPNSEQIQVAEYWVKEHADRALCELGAGIEVWRDDLPEGFDETQITDERDVDEVTVCQYIIDGVEPLEKTEFLVPFIPIAPLWGESAIVKGQRENYSLVRFVKDPQRLVNLYVSNIAGEIARMPKTPYIAAVGQLLNQEDVWSTINDEPHAFALYNAKDVAGNLLPPPRREINEPPIQALTLGLGQAIDAMKAGMGIFDSSLGEKSNETSGRAIDRRKQQSNITNYHFGDNEARTRKYIGRILLALIPLLDKGAKEVPTRSVDGKTKLVKVNQPYLDDRTGKTLTHDLGAGTYDIAVSTGPSYHSQREEAFDTYTQIAQGDKNFMPIAGDLLFRNSDAPGADQIADRYEKMLPPQLRPPDPNQNGQQQMAQAKQALQAMSQQHQQLVETVHKLSSALETKQAEQQARIQIAQMQEATKLAVAEITAKSQDAARASADALAVMRMREAGLDRAHDAALATTAHGVDAASQLADHAHARDLQQGQQDHAAGMQTDAQGAAAEAAETAAAQQPEPAAAD